MLSHTTPVTFASLWWLHSQFL